MIARLRFVPTVLLVSAVGLLASARAATLEPSVRRPPLLGISIVTYAPSGLAAMSDADLERYVFAPGFTAAQVVVFVTMTGNHPVTFSVPTPSLSTLGPFLARVRAKAAAHGIGHFLLGVNFRAEAGTFASSRTVYRGTTEAECRQWLLAFRTKTLQAAAAAAAAKADVYVFGSEQAGMTLERALGEEKWTLDIGGTWAATARKVKAAFPGVVLYSGHSWGSEHVVGHYSDSSPMTDAPEWTRIPFITHETGAEGLDAYFDHLQSQPRWGTAKPEDVRGYLPLTEPCTRPPGYFQYRGDVAGPGGGPHGIYHAWEDGGVIHVGTSPKWAGLGIVPSLQQAHAAGRTFWLTELGCPYDPNPLWDIWAQAGPAQENALQGLLSEWIELARGYSWSSSQKVIPYWEQGTPAWIVPTVFLWEVRTDISSTNLSRFTYFHRPAETVIRAYNPPRIEKLAFDRCVAGKSCRAVTTVYDPAGATARLVYEWRRRRGGAWQKLSVSGSTLPGAQLKRGDVLEVRCLPVGTFAAAWLGTVQTPGQVHSLQKTVAASTAALAVSGVAAVPTTAGGAELTFTLSAPATVAARVLNLAGRPIRTLCRARDCEAGANTLTWPGDTDRGLRAPGGSYLLELEVTTADGARARALARVTPNR